MPTGRLTKKTHVQWMCSVMSPPMTGPTAKAAAVVAAQIPIAVARSRSSGKVWLMIARVGGVIIAAPTPCRTRAPMRTPALGASPASSEATVKTPRPLEEEPAAAEGVGQAAPAHEQDGEGEHVAVDDPCQAARGRGAGPAGSTGRATLTTVLSRVVMKTAKTTAIRVTHRFGEVEEEGGCIEGSFERSAAVTDAII